MATKRIRRDDESRISHLPKPLLHNIVSFLPQKDAIRTSLLSKSWRQLGPTRPNIVLRESDFSNGNKWKFIPVLYKTLQTYQEQKLSVQDLHVEMSSLDSESSSFLGKLVKNMNVATFRLALTDNLRLQFPLSRLIFRAESLKEMYLTGLKLIDPEKVLFKHLKTLHLEKCYIEDDIFANIISSCPLIEYLALHSCKGLNTKKLNNHFTSLKSLYLGYVRLSAESFHNLSSNNYFPCLEELELYSCHVYEEEFVLSSRSIKRLIISNMPCKGAIDAANILYFKVSNPYNLPTSISLTTTSREWKSQIDILYSCSPYILLKINELLKSLSQSQVSFQPFGHYFSTKHGHFMGEPAVVEHLDLSRCKHHSFLSYPDMLICFFRICRPRYIIGMCSGISVETEPCSCCVELNQSCKSKIILKNSGYQCCIWQQDLEEIRSEVCDHNAKEWHHVQLGTLDYSTLRALSDKKHIRYRLKWRGG